jgi:hypothetical protein
MGLLLAGLPWALYNQSRPLLGEQSVLSVPRDDQYFVNDPRWREPYVRAITALHEARCAQVGLLAAPGQWEYLAWSLLRNREGRPVAVKLVEVPNVSRVLPAPTFTPCAIVALRPVAGDELTMDGERYQRTLTQAVAGSATESVAVFLPTS